jgi:hypothetical protein
MHMIDSDGLSDRCVQTPTAAPIVPWQRNHVNVIDMLSELRFAVCGDLSGSFAMFCIAFDTTSLISPAVSSRLICFAAESPK